MANKISMLPKQAGDQLTASEFNNIVAKIDAAIDELNENTYAIGQQNNAIQALRPGDVTYAELMTLITAELLQPGKLYRITDYRTVHYLVDYNGSHIQDESEDIIIITGPVEPLTVLAVSTTTLCVFAYSELYPGDILKYDPIPENWLQNNAFTPDNLTIITGFKGVIYRREDDKKNIRCNFDFRNVKMRMWSVEQPIWEAGTHPADSLVTHNLIIYAATEETDTEPGTNAIWIAIMDITMTPYLSFHPDGIDVRGYHLIAPDKNPVDVSMFVAINDCYDIVFTEGINQRFNYTHIFSNCSQIRINTFDQVIIGPNCYNVSIGENTDMVIIKENASRIRIGSQGGYIFIGDNCNNLKFGDSCLDIWLGNVCINNHFGDGCSNLTLPDNSSQNVFEEFVSDVDYTDVAIIQVGVPVYVHHLRNLMGSASQYYMGESEGNPTLLYFNNIINTISD